MNEQLFDRRAFLRGTLSAGVLAALAGCTTGAGTPANGSEAAEPTTLNIGIMNPSGIEPAATLNKQGIQVCGQLFDPLTHYDFATETLAPRAAQSYDVDETATTFTFTIKEASFHNGESVTSRDFKRAWERLVNPSTKSPNAYLLSLVEGYDAVTAGNASTLSGISCPDEKTLVVKLTSAYAEFPLVCAHPALAPIPAAALEEDRDFDRAPIGNGPFQMKGRWIENQNISLERFDDYVRFDDSDEGAASIAGITFAIQEDASSAYKAFRSEELDVCEVPSNQLNSAISDLGTSADGFTALDHQRLVTSNEATVFYIACNLSDEHLSSADLRWGISLALDRTGICDELYRDSRVPATDIVPQGIHGHREGSWQCCDNDRTEAKKRLDLVAPSEDGERDLSLTLLYRKIGGQKALAEEIAAELEKVGITLEIEEAKRDDFASRMESGDYQLALCAWTADTPSMHSVLYPLFSSANKGKYNVTGYSDETVDTKLTEAVVAADDTTRTVALQDANDAIAQQVPVIPLMYTTHATAVSRRIQELSISPDRINNYARCTVS